MFFKLNSIPALLLVLLFLITGMKGFSDLSGYQNMIAKQGFPLAAILAILVVSLKAFGAVNIIFDTYYSHDFARLLILFTGVATFLFHNFLKNPSEMNTALRNLAIIGGLYLLIQAEQHKVKSNYIATLLPMLF